ncbi:ABC transporter substrate-binding protein [Mycoplasma sp. P36-A1]|uniref:ABC transporter substrate-binding protein n=1 Tax=Mycoplasma sp. P36-A1 TaxID=3252900 RepID=UPI003C2B978A
MEALSSINPDIIFIGGRLSDQYDSLSKIAPVIYLSTDYDKGVIKSTKDNVVNVAKIFNKTDEATKLTDSFDTRIAALATKAKGKNAIAGMVTNSSFNTMGNESRASLIMNEVGFTNLAENINSTHGNESSFELLVEKNPEYIFALDRDSAINAKGAKLAEEVMNNALVKKTKASIDNKIFYLNPAAWYLVSGGITSTDIMIQDLEKALG